MVARHQKESRQVQARSGNETYYRYLDTDSERLVTSAIDCATGQLSGAATAEPYPNSGVTMSSHEKLRRAPPIIIIIKRLRDGIGKTYGTSEPQSVGVLKKPDE